MRYPTRLAMKDPSISLRFPWSLPALAVVFAAAACAADRPARVERQPVQEYFLGLPNDRAEKSPYRSFTHLGTDYGLMGPGRDGVKWEQGGIRVDLTGREWAGLWHSLAGWAREKDVTLDLARCYPACVRPAYQPTCAGLSLRLRGEGEVKLEIVSRVPGRPESGWTARRKVSSPGAVRDLDVAVPASELRRAKVVSWVAEPGSRLWVDALALRLHMPDVPFPQRVFLASFAKFAQCYCPETGVTKDRANYPAGRFDAVPASGMFALAACAAWSMGIVERSFAQDTLLRVHRAIARLPRARGLLPHFIHKFPTGYRASRGSEYSTVDSSLYYHSMLLAAEMLGEQTVRGELEAAVGQIQFDHLRGPGGFISQGVRNDGKTLIPSVWRSWGGETALVVLLERMALRESAAMRMGKSGRVYHGVGFIPEIEGLFYPQFLRDEPDALTRVNWLQARRRLLEEQKGYLPRDTAAAQLGVFGFSAGEGRRGVGYVANGTRTRHKTDLIHPHYMLLSGVLWDNPADIYARLRFMQERDLFPPWGLVENVPADLSEYLPMIGSLNAAFECLGAYHLWAKATGEPDQIYAAARRCPMTAYAIKAFYPD